MYPLAKLFAFLSSRRKQRLQKANEHGDIKAAVIVIGNITVGGTGKTPLLMALAKQLIESDLSVAVISRGYGGAYAKQASGDSVAWVSQGADPYWVGDEAALIAEYLEVPIVISRQRNNAIEAILERHNCDVILSDDGLQHYAMPRDIEIVLIDGARGFGNTNLLPAGPLREPLERLLEAQMLVINGAQAFSDLPGNKLVASKRLSELEQHHCYAMQLQTHCIAQLEVNTPLSQLNSVNPQNLQGICLHAVAGIGNPKRFFTTLDEQGLSYIEHSFSDHHPFMLDDLQFNDNKPIIMTAKDAIKCRAFIAELAVDVYILTVEAAIDERFFQAVRQLVVNKPI